MDRQSGHHTSSQHETGENLALLNGRHPGGTNVHHSDCYHDHFSDHDDNGSNLLSQEVWDKSIKTSGGREARNEGMRIEEELLGGPAFFTFINFCLIVLISLIICPFVCYFIKEK
uniref:Transmembrane protein n=1 Tax=Cacopsylla melanoneura TaxID=428564 RepID=A0A8D8U612_9HEMI